MPALDPHRPLGSLGSLPCLFAPGQRSWDRDPPPQVPAADVCTDAAVEELHKGSSLDRQLAKLTSTVRGRIVSAFGLSPKHVVPVKDVDFHRTTSGKIQRGQFKRGFVDGAYESAIATLAKPPSAALQLFNVCWSPVELPSPSPWAFAHAPPPSTRHLLIEFGASRDAALEAVVNSGDDTPTDVIEFTAASLLLDGQRAWAVVSMLLRHAPSHAPCADGMAALFALTKLGAALKPAPALLMLTIGTHSPSPAAADRGVVGTASVAFSGSWGFSAVVTMERLVPGQIHSVDASSVLIMPAAKLGRVAVSTEVQLALREKATFASRLRRAALAGRALSASRSDDVKLAGGSYLVAGGLGGLGLSMAPWLLASGASTLLLVSRTAKVSRDGQGLQELLDGLPADAVRVQAADASCELDVRALGGLAPCVTAGQLYLPHVEGGRPIGATSAAEFAMDFRAKAVGAFLVHSHLEARLALCLSFYASSVASFGGTRSAAYSTASAYIDGLVRSNASRALLSRAANLPVLVGAGTGAATFKKQLADAKSPLAAIAAQLHDVHRLVGLQLGCAGVCVPLPDDDTRIARGLLGIWLPRPTSDTAGVLSELSPKAEVAPAALPAVPLPAAPAVAVPRPDFVPRAYAYSVLNALLHDISSRSVDLDMPFIEAGVDSMMAAEVAGK